MRRRLGCVAWLVGWTFSTTPALADVYTWVDEEGTVHFQEEPPTTGRRVKKLRLPAVDEPQAEPRPDPPAPRGGGGQERAPPLPNLRSERSVAAPKPAPKVELYSTSWCPWCRKAREYFNGKGIGFTDYDIDKDAGALERKMRIDGHKRVPTAVIGGTVVRGYSPSAYRAALERP